MTNKIETQEVIIKDLFDACESLFYRMEKAQEAGIVEDDWYLTMVGLLGSLRDPENNITKYWITEVGEFTRRLLAKGEHFITTLNHGDLSDRLNPVDEENGWVKELWNHLREKFSSKHKSVWR